MLDNQFGRSMVETLGVLAIIGVLSVGGMAGFSKMISQNKVNKTLEQIGIISSKLSAVGSNAISYSGLSNKSAIKYNAVPAEAIVSTSGHLQNPFGGNIAIAPSSLVADAADMQAYTITYSGLSEYACVTLGSSDWSNSKNASLLGLGVGKSGQAATIINKIYQGCSSSATSSYAVGCPGGIPMEADTVANACDCSGNTCELVVKFF